ncbi:transposase [Gulosibacter sediminis]|uniref:transposase n=1 Tax=Gulosibacter sediminis TaxID=1729695 RepID=UPI0024A7A8F1|nr:transposase [Gulosibacter sediminis]
MVGLSRDRHGKTRARLLDLVPGRSGKASASWLEGRGDAFRQNVEVAALDPFAGYKTAIDDKLEGATGCSSPPADSPHDPHPMSEEPHNWGGPSI